MSLASSKHKGNSNLGMVWFDSGATLDLAATNFIKRPQSVSISQ